MAALCMAFEASGMHDASAAARHTLGTEAARVGAQVRRALLGTRAANAAWLRPGDASEYEDLYATY